MHAKITSNPPLRRNIIIGNHDLHNALHKATSVEIYDVVDLPDVYVRRKPTIDILDTKRGPFQIIALPYLSPSNMTVEGRSIEEISLSIRGGIQSIVDSLAEKAYKDLPTVLMSHFSVIGAVPGSERSILLGREVTIPISTLAREEFDYVAMGHIHKHQVLYDNPPIVYCGSMDRVDFNEEKEDKGFVEVSLAKGNTTYEFVRLDTRPFKTIYADGKGDNPYEAAVKAIEKNDLDDAIVKLKVEIKSTGVAALKERELYKILREKAFYVAGIEKNIISDQSHLRHPGITERMDIKDAIAEYIQKKDELKDVKEELLTLNDELMTKMREVEVE